MYYVVLDTNVINLDDDLSGADLTILLRTASERGLFVFFPEIVVIEMIEHRRQRLKSAYNDLEGDRETLGRLLGRTITINVSATDIDVAVEKFDTEFRELLQAKGIQVIPLPRAATDALILLRRDFAKRRPFRDGRGLRDTLIWESVLELCTGGLLPLAFITNNTRDFADSSGELLHDHLRNDLDDVGFLSNNAELHKSIRGFNEALSKRIDSVEH